MLKVNRNDETSSLKSKCHDRPSKVVSLPWAPLLHPLCLTGLIVEWLPSQDYLRILYRVTTSIMIKSDSPFELPNHNYLSTYSSLQLISWVFYALLVRVLLFIYLFINSWVKYNIQLIYYCIISPTNPLKHKRVEIFTRYQDTGNFVQIIMDYNNDN
jgi:hypothetical protein